MKTSNLWMLLVIIYATWHVFQPSDSKIIIMWMLFIGSTVLRELEGLNKDGGMRNENTSIKASEYR